MPLKDKDERNTYMRKYMLRRYHERRAKAITMLGGECINCGSTENLEFDHIDPTTKTFAVAKYLVSMAWKKVVAELEKCQLLCNNCHKRKTYLILDR